MDLALAESRASTIEPSKTPQMPTRRGDPISPRECFKWADHKQPELGLHLGSGATQLGLPAFGWLRGPSPDREFSEAKASEVDVGRPSPRSRVNLVTSFSGLFEQSISQ